MPQTPTASSTLIRAYLDAIMLQPAGTTAYLIVAIGRNPYLDAKGKYRHKDWKEQPFLWPDQADEVIAGIEYAGSVADVYVCPYPMKTGRRTLGNAAWRQIVHSDVDGDADELRAKVRKLGGFIVWSGTLGHGHAYLRLEYAVMPEQHKRLCEGVRDYLGADNKIRENDVLRPPGTFNHKPTLQGLPAAPVEAEKP